MKRLFFSLMGICFMITTGLAQGEFEETSSIVLRNELTYGLSLNTNGLGFNVMYGKRKDGFRKTMYSAELSYIKHSKEKKISNPSEPYAGQFVYGKANNFFTLKAGYGMMREKFEKRDKDGVAVKYYYTLGPSLGILKPIYYEYIYSRVISTPQGARYVIDSIKNEKYFDGMQATLIRGKAGLKHGLNEIWLSPGVYGRFAFSFDFTKNPDKIAAIEGGVTVESYLRQIRIMAVETKGAGLLSKVEDNGHVFISLFLSMRFGRIIAAKSIKG